MAITPAIAELLRAGPEQWCPSSLPDVAGCSRGHALATTRDCEVAWRDLCHEVVIPVLDDLVGITVASGAAGLWLHGCLRRSPIEGVRLLVARDDVARLVLDRVATRAARFGWHTRLTSTGLVLMDPGRDRPDVPVRLVAARLPDEALDGPFGYQRRTIADWALAVEALAQVAGSSAPGMVEAAAVDLHELLDQVPDVLWTHALRMLSDPERAPWLALLHARPLPELHELADAATGAEVAW